MESHAFAVSIDCMSRSEFRYYDQGDHHEEDNYEQRLDALYGSDLQRCVRWHVVVSGDRKLCRFRGHDVRVGLHFTVELDVIFFLFSCQRKYLTAFKKHLKHLLSVSALWPGHFELCLTANKISSRLVTYDSSLSGVIFLVVDFSCFGTTPRNCSNSFNLLCSLSCKSS